MSIDKLQLITDGSVIQEFNISNPGWLRELFLSGFLAQTDPVHTWAKVQMRENQTLHFIIQHATVPRGAGKLFMDAIVERSNPGVNNLIIWENFIGNVSEDSESLLTEQAGGLADKVKNGFVMTITQNNSIPQEVIAEALSMFEKVLITPVIFPTPEDAELELNSIIDYLGVNSRLVDYNFPSIRL